jgi:RNA polymerase sigma factor (sigma-70 family)
MTSVDYETFWKRSHTAILSSLIMASGDRADAEDAAQEGYAAAARNWDQVAGCESPEAWVRTAAIRRLWRIKADRRRQYRPALAVTVPPASTPEETAEAREVLAALAALPAEVRMAIIMGPVLGWPQQEIAAVCGVPRATVANRILRGRAKLRHALGLGHVPEDHEPLVTVGGQAASRRALPGDEPLDAVLTRTERWLRAGVAVELLNRALR